MSEVNQPPNFAGIFTYLTVAIHSPPVFLPSQKHCCLQTQAAPEELCWEQFKRGQKSGDLVIASIFSLSPFCPVIHLGFHLLSTMRGLTFCLTSRPVLLEQIVG